MDTPHPTLFFFFFFKVWQSCFIYFLTLGLVQVCALLPTWWLAVAARSRSPVVPTITKEFLLTWLYVIDAASRPSPPHCSTSNPSCTPLDSFVKRLLFCFFKIAFECASGAPFDASAVVSVPVGGDRKGGVAGAGRASPADTNRCGGSWVMFVNTHWGLILCTLYLLRTLYDCLSWALLSFGWLDWCPTLRRSFLKDCGEKCYSCLSVRLSSSSVHCSPRTWPCCCLQEYTSCIR